MSPHSVDVIGLKLLDSTGLQIPGRPPNLADRASTVPYMEAFATSEQCAGGDGRAPSGTTENEDVDELQSN